MFIFLAMLSDIQRLGDILFWIMKMFLPFTTFLYIFFIYILSFLYIYFLFIYCLFLLYHKTKEDA
jgi:hypothetical protein